MVETAQRQVALKLRLAATAKCIDLMDTQPEEMAIAEIYPLNAFVSGWQPCWNSARRRRMQVSSWEQIQLKEVPQRRGPGWPGRRVTPKL